MMPEMTSDNRKKFIIVFNGEAHSEGCVSGGTRITIESSKILKEKGVFDFMTICSREAALLCKKCGFDNQFLIWDEKVFTKKHEILNILESIIKPIVLIWQNRKKMRHEDIIVLSQSDFLYDVLPALFIKLLNWNSMLVAACYLLAPTPFKGYKFYWSKIPKLLFPDVRLLTYWLGQRVSFLFIGLFADKLLVADESDGRRIAGWGINKDKILAVGGGVETEKIDKTSPNDKINFDGVYVGRMHPQKGILELVDIWKGVVEKIPTAKLAVITDGKNSYAEKVFKKIKDYNLEQNIQIVWYIDFEEKYTFLKSCKIYITPEMYGDGGLATVEAMACGLATITSDNPAIRSMLPTGRFEVPLNDIKAFSNGVVTLLKDEVLRKEYSALAKSATKDWDWNTRTERIYEFISKPPRY